MYALNCTVQFKGCSLEPFARFDLFSKCWLSTSFQINFCTVVINLKRITVCHSFVGQCRSSSYKLKTWSPWWSGPVCQRVGLFSSLPLFYTPFLERAMKAVHLFVYFVSFGLIYQCFHCHFVYFVSFLVNVSVFWLPLCNKSSTFVFLLPFLSLLCHWCAFDDDFFRLAAFCKRSESRWAH